MNFMNLILLDIFGVSNFDEGKIVAAGTPEDIMRHSTSFTEKFLWEALNKKN